MPKVSRILRTSHRETSVARFLRQSTAFPAQVRKVSFEDTTSGSSSCSSKATESNNSVAGSCCGSFPRLDLSTTSRETCFDGEGSTGRRDAVVSTTPSSTSSMSPLHRSTAYESLSESQLLQHQNRSKRLLRRPTTSFCLSDLASSCSSSSQQAQSDDEEDGLTLPPFPSSSKPSCVSSPWGHFVDVVPMENGDCNDYPLTADNLENAYFHPDTLLFWSKCSNNSNRSNGRTNNRFEPYTKSTQRLFRKHSSTSSETFSHDFVLPPSVLSTFDHNYNMPITRTMNVTHEVEETMERLHF